MERCWGMIPLKGVGDWNTMEGCRMCSTLRATLLFLLQKYNASHMHNVMMQLHLKSKNKLMKLILTIYLIQPFVFKLSLQYVINIKIMNEKFYTLLKNCLQAPMYFILMSKFNLDKSYYKCSIASCDWWGLYQIVYLRLSPNNLKMGSPKCCHTRLISRLFGLY